MNVTQQLIARVREVRPELSQNQIADLLDASRQSVSQWVNGDREIKDANIVARIALKIGDKPAVWLEKFAIEQKAPREVVQWWHRLATAAAFALAALPLTNLWAQQDSNLQPRDYESPALTVEL